MSVRVLTLVSGQAGLHHLLRGPQAPVLAPSHHHWEHDQQVGQETLSIRAQFSAITKTIVCVSCTTTSTIVLVIGELKHVLSVEPLCLPAINCAKFCKLVKHISVQYKLQILQLLRRKIPLFGLAGCLYCIYIESQNDSQYAESAPVRALPLVN